MICKSQPQQQKLERIYMPLEIQIQKGVGPANAGTATVKLIGSLDTATAPELERQLAPLLAGRRQRPRL